MVKIVHKLFKYSFLLPAMTNISRTHSQMSMFDENSVNVSQFVQLTETFLGNEPTGGGFENLMKYIKTQYQETEEEKMERLLKVRTCYNLK